MKKIFTYSLLFAIFAQTAKAQIIIDSKLGIKPSDVSTMQSCSSPSSISSSGANVNVDYSGLTKNGSPTTLNYVTPSSTPYVSAFPNATVANFSGGSISAYAYYATSSSKMDLLGIGSSAYNIVYTDPQLFVNFPVKFNDNYNDVFKATYTVNGAEYRRTGTQQIVADAYGKITIPTGTYDYLRVKSTQKIIDSVYSSGFFIAAIQIDFVIYNYLNSNYKLSLFSFTEQTTSQGTSRSSQYFVSGTASVNKNPDLATRFEVYPNPSNGILNIDLNVEETENVNYKIYDLLGKEVLSAKLSDINNGLNKLNLNLTELPVGLYSINFESKNTKYKAVKFIIE